MFTQSEREEICNVIHQELAVLTQLRQVAGSYTYQCKVGGQKIFTHKPVGAVLHVIPRFL